MILAGGNFGSQALGSIRPDDTGTADAWPGMPIDVVINSVSRRHHVVADSLRITDTLGQQVTARFTLANPTPPPVIGDQIRIVWYDLVIFSGSIVRTKQRVNNTQTATYYECDCADHSSILIRRKLNRNFTDAGLASIVDSILDNELSGEGFTIGTIDRGTDIPLLDAKTARVLEAISEAAAATGQSLYIGFDKTINFISTTNPSIPLDLTVDTVEEASLASDLEAYRNKQHVIVTGTPASASSTDPLSVEELDSNDDQIAARQVLEGGTGIYEEYESITHPTSNAQADLQLLGIAYARLKLSVYGVPRSTLRARIRGYGYRAGQVGTVTLAPLGVSGEWLIQRVSLTVQSGRKLLYDLELVQSSTQWRSYTAWLNIVRTGRVTILPPTALTSTVETFNTPGATTWTVPVGVTTAQFSCKGAGGGGSDSGCYNGNYYYGGNGGAGGLGITIRDVVEGQVYDLVVGAKGVVAYPSGTSGTASQVSIGGGAIFAQGDGGGGGGPAFSGPTCITATNGSTGSGIGDAVTVGGGKAGGTGSHTISGGAAATDGENGIIEISY